MSVRESRVISTFINTEFSFLKDELDTFAGGTPSDGSDTMAGVIAPSLDSPDACTDNVQSLSLNNVDPKDCQLNASDSDVASLAEEHNSKVESSGSISSRSISSDVSYPSTQGISNDEDGGDELILRQKRATVQSSDHDDDIPEVVYGKNIRSSRWIFMKEEKENTDSADESGESSEVSEEQSENNTEDNTSREEASGVATPSSVSYRRGYTRVSAKGVVRQKSSTKFVRLVSGEIKADLMVELERMAKGDGLGFHVAGSFPTVVSTVIKGSQAEQKGMEVDDVILAIDYESMLQKNQSEIVNILKEKKKLTLELCKKTSMSEGNEELQVDTSDVYSAYMYLRTNNKTLNMWNKRWFVLKSDNCLYYYKKEQEVDILGAIPLAGYLLQKTHEFRKSYTFKLMHTTMTYYLAAYDEQQFTEWARVLNEATKATSTMDNWIATSAHNVGLPALSIRDNDCNGFLYKMGGHHKNWKKRYCVLKDGCLFYYCDIDSHSAQGVAHLHGYKTVNNPMSSKRNAFDLAPPEPNMRTFHFYTDTELDKERWLRAMKLSIGRWIQVQD